MNSLSIEGKIHVINNEQRINEKFKKREFVIKTDEQYPQVILFELIQDKTELINSFNIGDDVEVYFNLRGREWQKDNQSEIKIFNSLNAWKINKIDNAKELNETPF